MTTNLDLLRAFARYQTHGGYSWGAVMHDGELLCERCVRENYRQCYRETRDSSPSDWACIGLTHSGESETTEHCAHCNRVLWECEPDPPNELEKLRVSIARIAQRARVDNHLGVTGKSYNELCTLAREHDRGWNDLAGAVADWVSTLQT